MTLFNNMEKSSRDSAVRIDTSELKTFLSSTLTPMIANLKSSLEMLSRPQLEWNGVLMSSSLREEQLNLSIG